MKLICNIELEPVENGWVLKIVSNGEDITRLDRGVIDEEEDDICHRFFENIQDVVNYLTELKPINHQICKAFSE